MSDQRVTKPAPSGSAAYFDLVRSSAGADLDGAHYDDLLRLVRTIRYGSPTQLLLVEFDDVAYREDVIGRIDAVARDVGMRPGRYALGPAVGDVRGLEDELAALAENCDSCTSSAIRPGSTTSTTGAGRT